MKLGIVIVGAGGRMGRSLITEIAHSDDLELVGAVEHAGSPRLGQDAGEVVLGRALGCRVQAELTPAAGSVVVDFSLPSATSTTLSVCRAEGVALVLGTTGLSSSDEAMLRETSAEIPIVRAANFSVGVTLLTELTSIAASSLDWESELVEIHHRHKRDAPSGTALRLGEAVAHARGRALADAAVYDRHDRDRPRGDGEIGLVAMRGGDVVGEHTVYFFGDGERIELTHKATDRGIFARGALRAARWLADRPAGLYDMVDVLGLRSRS